MKDLCAKARRLVARWGKRPSRASSSALRSFYSRHARSLPLALRAELCLALGEAAEAEDRLEVARYLYASAVSGFDPGREEAKYVRAALRVLLNAWRRGDRAMLAAAARQGARLRSGGSPRLAFLGSLARELSGL